MSEREFYELADRAVTAIESIAWSLTMIEKHLAPQVQKQEYPLDAIPGLDDLEPISPEARAMRERDDDYLRNLIPPQKPEQEVDAASLAREAEELLNAASTPEVRTGVDIGEGEKPTKQVVRINLFKQDRQHDIFDLAQSCTQDDVVEVWRRKVATRVKTGESLTWHSLTDEEKTLAAAIELVYTHLPHEMWGGEEAAKAVKQFVTQHSEDA